MAKRMKMLPFTLTMLKRVRKEVQTQKRISSAIIARKRVIINQSVGFQEAEKRVKVLIKRGKRKPKQKKLLKWQKKMTKTRRKRKRLRKHG